ncbi:MAG TPA: hypothetical protein VJ767_09695 [Nitrososphaeraceae archaeon]|nr:hypothetical protein [Nitrososphaeraceae archaeon]
MIFVSTFYLGYSFAQSTFHRQTYTDGMHDIIIKCKNQTYNKIDLTDFNIDLKRISFSSDGKTLNASIWSEDDRNIIKSNNNPNGNIVFNTAILLNVIKIDAESYNKNLTKIFSYFKNELNNIKNNSNLIKNYEWEKMNSKDMSYYNLYYYINNSSNSYIVDTYWFLNNDFFYIFKYSGLKSFYLKFQNEDQKTFNKMIANKNYFENYLKIVNYSNLYDKEKLIYNIINESSNSIASSYYPIKVKIDKIQYYMIIDVISAYDKGQDYFIKTEYNKTKDKWIMKTFEFIGDKTRFSLTEDYRLLDKLEYNGSQNIFIPLSFDLSLANNPPNYNFIFISILETEPLIDSPCFFADVSDPLSFPLSIFTMNLTKNPVQIRTGEPETVVQLNLISKSNNELLVNLLSGNPKNVDFTIIPKEKIFLSPYEVKPIYIKIKGAGNSDIESQDISSIPIVAKISFPISELIIKEPTENTSLTFSNKIPEIKNLRLDLILITLPAFQPLEKFTMWINSWLNAVSGLWSFLAGVAAVIAPLLYRLLTKKKDKNTKITDYD